MKGKKIILSCIIIGVIFYGSYKFIDRNNIKDSKELTLTEIGKNYEFNYKSSIDKKYNFEILDIDEAIIDWKIVDLNNNKIINEGEFKRGQNVVKLELKGYTNYKIILNPKVETSTQLSEDEINPVFLNDKITINIQ